MKLMRVNEAARELGIAEAWLRRSERRSRIPKARQDVNGWRIYPEEDLDTLLQVLFPHLAEADGVDEGTR